MFTQPLLPWKLNSAFPFYCWFTYVTIKNEINIESTAMETQLCILFIVALYVAAENMKLN